MPDKMLLPISSQNDEIMMFKYKVASNYSVENDLFFTTAGMFLRAYPSFVLSWNKRANWFIPILIFVAVGDIIKNKKFENASFMEIVPMVLILIAVLGALAALIKSPSFIVNYMNKKSFHDALLAGAVERKDNQFISRDSLLSYSIVETGKLEEGVPISKMSSKETSFEIISADSILKELASACNSYYGIEITTSHTGPTVPS